jgi:ADP-heptose:LPS heptosyltransferase
MLKKLLRFFRDNPLDALLKKANKKKAHNVLLVWNRGLGDIPLGLYAIVYRIKSFLPNAKITFITRADLLEGFKMLDSVEAIASTELIRNVPYNIKTLCLTLSNFDLVIEKPDPTYWVSWQLGKLQPLLFWDSLWDQRVKKFSLPSLKHCIACHVHSETTYGYEKNWPFEKWEELFCELSKTTYLCILFGKTKTPLFSHPNIIDLRGQTTILDVLAIIKTRCLYFIGPDSGILSLLYYINAPFMLRAVSLWADPKQGILKQNVISPNPLLQHFPILAKNKDMRTIDVKEVLRCLFQTSL